MGGQVSSSLVSSSDLLTSNPERPYEDIQLWSSSNQLKSLLPRLNYKKLNPFAYVNSCSRLGELNVLYMENRTLVQQRKQRMLVQQDSRPAVAKKGRSSSSQKWPLVQTARTSGRSSRKWPLVRSLVQNWDARPEIGRSSRNWTLVQKISRDSIIALLS
ncbi:hypothetical protein LR48_Vigan09g167400 [Vigna angularis]|uniref:Uncharacterized protein n=1 Tax=Phaseolus angularis TaxID=3914 RepID=A0A0L9VD86_PHAAN|nr:hypothetical protein LR48_Vigan09g167400 [Vigna angularis]